MTMYPKIYLVGGAVRDLVMGVTPKDQDFVITGANEKWLTDLGFTRVGMSFPVFHHPITGDEYALARVERKTGEGYNGFTVDTEDVTIEQDLYRRDLTMNAMAIDLDTGKWIDPYDGFNDIEAGVIRHVSDAFSEDPLRVIRVARFVARYGFDVAPETFDMCIKMVMDGQLDTIAPERIWAEMYKLLSEPYADSGLLFLNRILAFEYSDRLKFIDKNRITSELTFITSVEDKVVCVLNRSVANDPKKAQHYKIPNEIVLRMRFYDAFMEIYDKYLNWSTDMCQSIVKFYDTFKNRYLSHETIDEFFNVYDIQDHYMIGIMKRCLTKLSAIDFTEITKGKSIAEIKEIVWNTKISVVRSELYVLELKNV